MPVEGQFNTDAEALKKRISAHSSYGTKDLNEWIFEKAQLEEGMDVLDLGCGNGKQAIPAAQIVGPTGTVTAIDLSQESLDILKQTASEQGLENIQTHCIDLDEIDKLIEGKKYNRIIGSYSLYYAKDYNKLLGKISKSLKKGGTLFYCGPSKKNNFEIKEFHYTLANQEIPPATEASEFMEDTRLTYELFENLTISTFENPLRFDSADSLYEYWSSYNLYDESLDQAFKDAAKKHFESNDFFETVKRVVGVKVVG